MKLPNKKIYLILDLIIKNIIIFFILFLLINLIFLINEKISFNADNISSSTKLNPWFERYGPELLKKVYPDLSLREINTLLTETYVAKTAYMPFSHTKNAEVKSKNLNVHKIGFRSLGKYQGDWPPNKNHTNIFMFGGSTLLGAGISDEQTIPSYLQKNLRLKYKNDNISIYNFGVGSHFSTNERALFEFLITSGVKPSHVIFLDGLNDFYFYNGIPPNTNYMERYFNQLVIKKENKSWATHLADSLMATPVGRYIVKKVAPKNYSLMEFKPVDEKEVSDKTKISTAINKLINNFKIIEAVSEAFNIQALFVIQPTPFYKYNGYEDLLKNFGPVVGQHKRSFYGYPILLKKLDNYKNLPILSCADIQNNINENLYVDHVHYNKKGSKLVANCIADSFNLIIQ